MKELLEQGIGVVVIGCVTGLGVLVRTVLFGYYGRLSRACERMEKTNHKMIVYIREDLKQREKSNQYIKSTMTYTECRLAECKVAGLRIGSIESLSQQTLLLVLLCGVLSALAGVLSGVEVFVALFPLCLSGGGVFGLLLLDLFVGIKEKQKRIRLCIRDYIDNNRFVQKDGEEENIRENTKKIKVKKKGKAQEEKRRLTEELLRERRQLEARSLAEQRRRERAEEVAVQQVQAEAAVTECEESVIKANAETTVSATSESVPKEVVKSPTQGTSYETLLGEVLAEYLS